MKKTAAMLLTLVFVLSFLTACRESTRSEAAIVPEGVMMAEASPAQGAGIPTILPATSTTQDIKELVTIKEAVNREALTPNGDKGWYIYQVPVLNIDKPGAQQINSRFLALVKDMETRIGNGQNMTFNISAKAFLNNGVISLVMDIKKPGPGGIQTANYELATDKEISTADLLQRYQFDPQRLIAEINKQTLIDNAKPKENQLYDGSLLYLFAISTAAGDDMDNKTKDEQEKQVLDHINKLKAYINHDGAIVFVFQGRLPDEELVISA